MEKKLKVGMFGHKRVPSREGGIEIVVEELAKGRVIKLPVITVQVITSAEQNTMRKQKVNMRASA